MTVISRSIERKEQGIILRYRSWDVIWIASEKKPKFIEQEVTIH
jgi:hypothetical protein